MAEVECDTLIETHHDDAARVAGLGERRGRDPEIELFLGHGFPFVRLNSVP